MRGIDTPSLAELRLLSGHAAKDAVWVKFTVDGTDLYIRRARLQEIAAHAPETSHVAIKPRYGQAPRKQIVLRHAKGYLAIYLHTYEDAVAAAARPYLARSYKHATAEARGRKILAAATHVNCSHLKYIEVVHAA